MLKTDEKNGKQKIAVKSIDQLSKKRENVKKN